MIKANEIENIIGCRTMMTDAMQHAIEDWYEAAIEGKPMSKDPETLSLGLPGAICGELSRLTTLELDAKVSGSDRADWINAHLQRVISPRRRRKLTLALALGSGVWKPYQSGNKIGVSFSPATGYYPVSTDANGDLEEAVFIDQIADQENYYNRLEWMHVLEKPQDYRETELAAMARFNIPRARTFPCVQVINLTFLSSSKDTLGEYVDPGIRPEWDDVKPAAFLQGLDRMPVGYFVTPIVNTVDPTSELGAAMFAPAKDQIIDADEQYTRLDWEYEGGELAVDVDQQYLKDTPAGPSISRKDSLRKYGVAPSALDSGMAKHRNRLYHGIDVNTGITQAAPFYQVFAPGLRDGSYMAGLNQYLRQVESHAGLSYGVLSQVSEVERTATEVINSKQKLYATVSDLQNALEDALRGLVDALNYWADNTEGAPPAGQIDQAYHWDDSIILDRQTEMAMWQQELSLGLRSRQEYRMHFNGEDAESAAAALQAIQQEAVVSQMIAQGVMGGAGEAGNQPDE